MGELVQQMLDGGRGQVSLAEVRNRYPDFCAAWAALKEWTRQKLYEAAAEAIGRITPAELVAENWGPGGSACITSLCALHAELTRRSWRDHDDPRELLACLVESCPTIARRVRERLLAVQMGEYDREARERFLAAVRALPA